MISEIELQGLFLKNVEICCHVIIISMVRSAANMAAITISIDNVNSFCHQPIRFLVVCRIELGFQVTK